MTSEQFVRWLRRFVAMNDGLPPSAEQWLMIQEHLATEVVATRPAPPPMRIIRDGGWLTKFSTKPYIWNKGEEWMLPK